MRNIRSNISPYEDVLGGLAKFTISLSNGSSLPEKEVPDSILFKVSLSLGGYNLGAVEILSIFYKIYREGDNGLQREEK